MAVLGRWWGSLARRQGPDQQRRDGTWAVGQRGGFPTYMVDCPVARRRRSNIQVHLVVRLSSRAVLWSSAANIIW